MRDIIHLLPDSVANQIAAGQVIQRPSSVIKELVENAVDAGAKHIKIFIKDAGRTLIQVSDDGCGMTDTDARMAFERHATSKISKATDLFTLMTMGFRGEALPSICAVSQVEVRTRTSDSPLGTLLKIDCSKVVSQEPCACGVGTTITARNIFCNVPARRKFLKSDSVELANIMREFERLALVNNEIRMSIDTGNKTLDLHPGPFRRRIVDLFRNSLDSQIIPVECETSVARISGFVTRPEFARRRNALQYFIVNGRNMRHPYFHKGVLTCFERLIATDTQPCYFIRFDVDPSTIDVNIHPTKDEIKFENEREIWSILTATIRAALGKFGSAPSIDFNTEALPIEPARRGDYVQAPSEYISKGYNPFDNQPSPRAAVPERPDRNWSRLYDDFMKQASRPVTEQAETGIKPESLIPPQPMQAPAVSCVQLALKYILTSTSEGLLVIDQHRAHVRILYEQFMRESTISVDVSQRIMFGYEVDLGIARSEALEGVKGEIRRLGFIMEPLGGGKWMIKGVPPGLGDADPAEVVTRIADSINADAPTYGESVDTPETILSRVATAMARAAAIVRGRKLSPNEMEHLVSRLFQCKSPKYTPSGNLVMVVVPETEIAKLFSS